MKPIPNKWRNRLIAASLSVCGVCACLTFATSRGGTSATNSLDVLSTATNRPVITATSEAVALETDTPEPTATNVPATRTPRPSATDRPPTDTALPTRTLAPLWTATPAGQQPTTAPAIAPANTAAPQPTQAPLPTQPPPPPTQAVFAGYVCGDGSGCIKGNISQSDGRRLYHFPGCPNYNATVIDTGAGERWFVSEGEAQAAGWVKAGNCP